ncbi:NUDIX domain-containing protein [uncultured Maribacter sp.]|uniref:NUDIX domain-containing protein n=1 Tax=uncultured Maribacter sp. TaxID=431308 RepID=UPI0030D9E5B0|tara:strand:+ start:29 stop:496 length:468 start_codon:yes stop_codon:yes gene_type:complete
MPKISAGIILYRLNNSDTEVLLVHPGGPFWVKKNMGSWSIPKGEIEPEEDLLEAAIRETKEETGIKSKGKFIALSPLKQKSGKIIHAWALQGNFDPLDLKSNSFEMIWPPKSGKNNVFPEIDKAAWFPLKEAKLRIVPGQIPFITELENLVNRWR